MSRKHRVPARVSFRVDHEDLGAYFYAEVFSSREAAEKHIDDRNPSYRDKLTVVEFVEPEHDAWYLGTVKI